MPSTSKSILKYLSSGAVKGVGKATAKRIVDNFGDKALEVIQNEPSRLTQIKGISHDKAMLISGELKKVFGIREVMMYLDKYHISSEEVIRVWKMLGSSAVSLIEENPYILCGNGINVSFERADMIAAALDKPCDDNARIRAGLMYIISYNAGNGHTCIPKEKHISVAAGYLKLSPEKVSDVLSEMIIDGSFVSETLYEKEFIFLPSLYRSEMYVSERLGIMLKFPPDKITGVELALDAFEENNGIKYASLQRKAIIEALSGGLLILTGGPGTGKTTTLNAIISLFSRCGLKVALAAPTGRAAQRMTEITGYEAKTIHRMLEVEWDKRGNPVFKRNERNLLDCDALILDELSMVDISVFESVIRALPLGCRLIMVGDTDQLPSVGAGNVLGDLIDSKKIPVVQLNEIFRQSMQSLIVTNAHKIVNGEMPEIRRTDNDFFFMSYNDKESIASAIVELCKKRLPNTYGFSPLDDIQVLCPGRKGELGVTELNKRLQQALNPCSDKRYEINMPIYSFHKGDKVMQTKNNYELFWTKDDGTDGAGIFNGDIGVIESVDKSASEVSVRFDDKLAVYDAESMKSLELAYATTVHKSQGNEFNAVIMPMYNAPPQLLYRNLLYTAVTRAKKLLILIGNPSILKRMVDNNKKTMRYSALKAFLERGE